jgi:hypothetical protein
MQAAAKMQKLLRAISSVRAPSKNASTLVNEVIVMDGPAWNMAFFIRSSTGKWSGV